MSVAQPGRAPDCDSGRHGFKSRLAPHTMFKTFSEALEKAIQCKEVLRVRTCVIEDNGLFYVVGRDMVPPEREHHIKAQLSEIFYADYVADKTAIWGTYITE